MLPHFYQLLEDVSTVATAPAGSAATAAAGTAAGGTAAGATAAAGGGMSTIFMILVWVAVIAICYFLTIRPQSKRDKQLKQLQSSIQTGDSVLTSAGFYGKVIDIGEDCFIVEFGTNRGVHVPVRKSDILGIKEPNMTMSHPADKEDSGKAKK
jgi:preprotein translocase subunit YajC